MNIIGALDAPDSGSYRLDGQEVGSLPRRQLAKLRSQSIGFIFQNSSLIPSLTAFENVELPLSYRRIPKARRKALAAEALTRVGLADRMQHLPGQLSGGQRQRTAIARAIAASPELILADEPTGSLDQRSGSEVMQQLSALHQSGKTILLITHDPKVAAYADRTVYLRAGKLTAEKDSL
jgi:putative ABC transport system ATP-binding protein